MADMMVMHLANHVDKPFEKLSARFRLIRVMAHAQQHLAVSEKFFKQIVVVGHAIRTRYTDALLQQHSQILVFFPKSLLAIKQPNPERTVLQAFHKTFTPIWETPAIDVTTTPRTGTLNQFALRKHGGNTYFLQPGTKISLRIVVASCF